MNHPIQSQSLTTRQISKRFRSLGLILQKEAVFAVQNVLKNEVEPVEAMELILDATNAYNSIDRAKSLSGLQ